MFTLEEVSQGPIFVFSILSIHPTNTSSYISLKYNEYTDNKKKGNVNIIYSFIEDSDAVFIHNIRLILVYNGLTWQMIGLDMSRIGLFYVQLNTYMDYNEVRREDII